MARRALWCWVLWLVACAPTEHAGPYEPCVPGQACSQPTRCMTVPRDMVPRHLCSDGCQTDADCPMATAGGVARVCVRPPGQSSGGVCLLFCAEPWDCTPGTVCRPLVGVSGESLTACVP
ncbi:MAG: hypothetical protein HY909_11005 [Deltaproteobacteria bacterium]|nr:hypothetical protein [Deltaproteobacteria bacterium]